MLAIISDIHANAEALEAVLQSAWMQGIEEIWCLGDLVGYGPNPQKCIDLIQKNCKVCLMGNHDWAVLHSPVSFNSIATRMIYKTKKWLKPAEDADEQQIERWEFLENLPKGYDEDDSCFFHASPRDKLTEYLLPSDVQYDREKLQDVLEVIDHYCFVGHTHVPCCIKEGLELVVPEGNGFTVELDERNAIINVGSVGQPRDGDNRASYVILDENRVTWCRVPYRFEKTAAEIAKLGKDYEILGHRLRVGR